MKDCFYPVVDEKSSKSQKIVSQIRQLFADGTLKPGEKLPSERELAIVFNVSRTSVREALRTMAALDLVEIKVGCGVFVKEAMLHSVMNNAAHTLVISQDEVRSLFEIRRVLETRAAAWAALRASEEEIAYLAGLVKEARISVKSKKNDIDTASIYDKRFHSTVLSISQNQVLVKIMSGIFDVLDRVRIRSATVPGRVAQSINDHEEIAEAIAARDPERAMEAMYVHIDSVEKSIGSCR